MDSEINTIIETSKKNIKHLKKFRSVVIVIGNESCDLDSAISSLVYSVLLNHKRAQDCIVFPVLNIPRVQLPVKTEVNYFLRKNNINVESIVCKDEVDLQALHKDGLLQLYLVDHHVLQGDEKQLIESVVSVTDHRPQDPSWLWPKAELTLRRVGSCCTLVAEKLLLEAPDLITPTIAILLLGTILFDTIGLLTAAGIATPLDIKIVDQLEPRCVQPVDRNKVLSDLRAAKSDISSLTSAQLLIKDLKVTAGIPIVGLPIKVKNFVKREDASSAIKEFCLQYKTNVCILYGMEASPETITRDLAVYSHSDAEVALQLVSALKESKDPDLNLQPVQCSVEGLSLFEQLNIKATRKHLLPLVRKIGEEHQNTQ